MTFIKSIFTITIVLGFIFTSVKSFALSTSSSNSSNQSSSVISSQLSNSTSSQQPETVERLPDSKKLLKKKISLDYTHPKFETEISESQKNAILKALKKWKGDLPINNTFTITSYADLKTDTSESKYKSKKKKNTTPSAMVVYMWSSNLNPKWDISKIPSPEEYESGDPRYIRTEFNVLLKQDKNNWKASIERDSEVKTDSESITESQDDLEVYQDLFGTNKVDNFLTGVSDILIDDGISSSSLSSISNISSTSSVSTLASQTTLNSSSSNISTSLQSQISSVASSKKIGLLESLFNFGNVHVNAGATDNSWPWKNGETWSVGSFGWHELLQDYFADGVKSPSLDFIPPSSYKTGAYNSLGNPTWKSIPLYAPKTATIVRAQDCPQNSTIAIGDMRILHMAPNSFFSKNGVTYKPEYRNPNS
jgi:hypothetical protein